MTSIQSLRNRLAKKNQRGLSTVEYVIILVLIAAVCVATWSTFGTKLKAWLGTGVDTIDGKVGAPDTADGIGAGGAAGQAPAGH